MASKKAVCPVCGRLIKLGVDNTLHRHGTKKGCAGGGREPQR